MVIATDAMPTHWALYFKGSGLPLPVSGSWSGSTCRTHIVLLELQAGAMMPCRMPFSLSGKVVALHLNNSTANAYLYNQGGTVSLFLSRLACWILNLTDYLSQGHLLPEWHLLTHMAQVGICLQGIPEVDLLASSQTTQHQHYYTLEIPLPLGPWG